MHVYMYIYTVNICIYIYMCYMHVYMYICIYAFLPRASSTIKCGGYDFSFLCLGISFFLGGGRFFFFRFFFCQELIENLDGFAGPPYAIHCIGLI